MITTLNANAAIKAVRLTLKQLPYAWATATNQTARDFQAAERVAIQGRFTLRRAPFILNTVKIPTGGFATKDHLAATVLIDPTRDFLAKFEAGGRKVSLRGGNLAVPDSGFNGIVDASQIIPRRLRPAALDIAQGPAQAVRIRRRDRNVHAGRQRLARQGLNRTYLIPGLGIFQRRGHGPGSTTVPLYLFERSVPIHAQLHFLDTARETASTFGRANFAGAFVAALRGAR